MLWAADSRRKASSETKQEARCAPNAIELTRSLFRYESGADVGGGAGGYGDVRDYCGVQLPPTQIKSHPRNITTTKWYVYAAGKYRTTDQQKLFQENV